MKPAAFSPKTSVNLGFIYLMREERRNQTGNLHTISATIFSSIANIFVIKP
jgi:hypothetical protein